MTAPKVGDRVRVRELTGHVDSIMGGYAGLTLEAAGRHDVANLPLHALTVIHPPVRVGDVIDTAEELDALPDDVILRNGTGCAVQRSGGVWFAANSSRRSLDFVVLPATVLYLPDGAA